jgi:predicted Zn finger-like uncharacterized protein
MPFAAVCPSCQARYTLADTVKGKQVRCKQCGKPFAAAPAGNTDLRKGAPPNQAPVPVASGTDAAAARPAQKGHGKVIALVVVLLLAVGGGAAWFFVWGPGKDMVGKKKEVTEADLEATFNDMAKDMSKHGLPTMPVPKVDNGKVVIPNFPDVKIDPGKLPKIDPGKLPDLKIDPSKLPDVTPKTNPPDKKPDPEVEEKPVVKADPPAPMRKPVPKDAELAAAEKLIKDVFKDEYAKTTTADKLALAQKLLEQARETKDDMAARYLLFREAIDLATQAGDLNLAFKAADELGKDFVVSGASLKAAAIDKAVAAVAPGDAKALAETLLPIIDEAAAADDYEAAARIAKAAEAAAKKAKTLALLGQVQGRAKDLDTLKASFEKVQVALTTLKTTPDDADANLLVGRHYCFAKGDWGKGLPFLIKGSDAALKALAEKDLALPTVPADQLAVADAWYDLAAKESPKLQLQLRAQYWYKEALPGLTGLTKTKAEKRLAELEKLTGSGEKDPWLVIFRSADPTLWGKSVNKGRDDFALDLKKVPENINFLKLTDAKTGDYVIVPITREKLTMVSDDGRYGWNGINNPVYKGYQLGIYDAKTRDKKGDIVIYAPGPGQGKPGWGFGHRAYIGDVQGYGWAGKEIEKTVFVIAVKAGPLTAAEGPRLMKK